MAKNNSQKKTNTNGVSKEVLQFAEEHGYSYAEITKGYVEKSDPEVLGGAVYVEHIHGIEKFNSDEELVEYLETKKKISVLKDLPDCLSDNERKYFLETAENKEKVKKAIKDKYNFVWEKIFKVVDRNKLAESVKENKAKYGITDGVEYTILKAVGVCSSFRDKDDKSVYMWLGENEYYCEYTILVDLIKANYFLVKETELTDDLIIYS